MNSEWDPKKAVDQVLWFIAVITLFFDSIIMFSACSCGSISRIAVGVMWIFLGFPAVVGFLGNISFVIVRLVVVPIWFRQLKAAIWLDKPLSVLRDLTMYVALAVLISMA